MKNTLYKILRPLIVLVTKVFLRPRFIGLDNIPKDKNYILAGNHTHNLDCFLLITASKKDVHFLAKQELFKGLKGLIFNNMGLIPVDRKKHTTKAFDKSIQFLNNNKVIGIFPEGTYPKNGEKLLDFKSGVVKMSKMTNTMIIPFVIKGKYRLFSNNLTIEFLKPYEVKSDNYDDEIFKFRKVILKKSGGLIMSIFDIFRGRKTKLKGVWEKYYNEDELNYDIPNITMYEQILLSENKYPHLTAIKYLGTNISYRKLVRNIERAAISFKKMGVGKGDIVTICLPNFPEALYCLYALNKLGAIANMTHPLSSENELKDAVNSVNSKILVMCNQFYKTLEPIINETKLEHVIFVKASDSMNPILGILYNISCIGKFKKIPIKHYFMTYKHFIRKSFYEPYVKYRKFGKNQPAVIIHSGGTSGTPKNVVIQNRAFILGAKQTGDTCLHLKPGDSCLAIMPNFHGFGLSVCMHTALTLGCYTTLVPQFDAKKFDVLFNKTKPTVVLGVPTLFEALINNTNIPDIDLSYLKFVVSGGDTLPKTLENRVNEYLKKHNSSAIITQGYGLSEALAAVSLCYPGVQKSGSIGIPLPGNYIKIINSNREELPFGEVGEIVIHSKALMMGYLNNESETNETLQIHDDGHIWLHTGDLGYMDEDGFIFYKGRSKRMIITSGYNVYPSHVEDIIEDHPDVLQCTVVGIPHPYKQEVCKAFIVLKSGRQNFFVKASVKEYCKKNLAKYMIPQEYVFRKQLPKTKLGKVDFKTLQEDKGEDDDE